MKIQNAFHSLPRYACGAALALTFAIPVCGQSWSYPIGRASASQEMTLPPKLAQQWVQQGAALAQEQLRQIQTDRHQSASRRALASFALAAGEMRRRQADQADHDLNAAAAWAPVRDVAADQLALLHWEQQDWNGVVSVARQYSSALRVSPFQRSVAHLAVQSAIRLQQWETVLQMTPGLSMGPERLAAEGQALAGLGREGEALARFEQLQDEFPASPEASATKPQWQELLDRHPAQAPGWRQLAERAQAWQQAGDARKAAETWQEVLPNAPATQQAAYRMQLARAWALAGEYDRARELLPGLMRGPSRPEALLLDLELARSKDDLGAVEKTVSLLRVEDAGGQWYRRSLWESGNEAVLHNDLLLAQAHYDSLVKQFPHSPDASTAAWRAAWVAYRLHQSDAGARMDAIIRQYPTAPEVTDALYWRGRWAEAKGAMASARQYYQLDAERFPGSYFGEQAAQRLAGRNGDVQGAVLNRLRREIPDPPTPRPGPLTRKERQTSLLARQLASAWMLDPAATILRANLHSSSAGGLTIARQLAAIDQQRESWAGGIAAMERAIPESLGLEWRQLPRTDWDALYPYPYRTEILRAAAHWEVNPYMVLGLIRQESDFNPASFSHAQARGLMQLLYGTAMIHAKELQWPRISPADLFRPEINIPLGVAEFKSLMDEFHGVPAYALAAYNAGGSRVHQWLQQGPYQDVNEFIESIPFHETRGYVQAVLRNEEHYRHLYQSNPS